MKDLVLDKNNEARLVTKVVPVLTKDSDMCHFEYAEFKDTSEPLSEEELAALTANYEDLLHDMWEAEIDPSDFGDNDTSYDQWNDENYNR